MTDATLRELERRSHASGSVEDEAAWLRARVQAGDLEQSKLELATYLGSLAARVLLGDAAPEHTKPPKTGVKTFVREGLLGHLTDLFGPSRSSQRLSGGSP